MPFSNPTIDITPLTSNTVTGKDSARTIGVQTYDASTGGDQDFRTRLAVRLSEDPEFPNSAWYYSGYYPKGIELIGAGGGTGPGVVKVDIPSLQPDTKYYVRIYIQRSDGTLRSAVGASFFTNRPPNAPGIVSPAENASFDSDDSIFFDWTFSDPDGVLGAPYNQQNQYQWRWRTAATSLNPAGPWTTMTLTTATTNRTEPASTFVPNAQHEWQVRTKDNRFVYGPWSDTRLFYVGGLTTSPIPLTPSGDTALDVADPVVLVWRFRDPNQDSVQTKADVRYREVGTGPWTTLTGDTTTPGAAQEWTLAAGALSSGVHYEWQVQTTNSATLASEWSSSVYFWVTGAGDNSGPIIPVLSEAQEMLGVGDNKAYLYKRGGRRQIGQITPMTKITWNRKRDDISDCSISTNGFGDDNGELLKMVRTWRHEVVVFRDDVRVWEGPVTRIQWKNDHVEIEAKDVMAYVYRRIMRHAYNDSYRLVSGVQQGLKSVVFRARAILMNALSYDDPNVLPYVTALVNADDTTQSRVVPGYIKTAYSEIDDMAATAGLDYTVVGRRIVLVDTHRSIGRLPEMMDGDFSDPPVVTEYGMQAANVFAVTNNSGVFGITVRLERPDWATSDPDAHGYITSADTVYKIPPEGYLEQIASAYGESVGAATETTLTAKAKAKLTATLRKQATRNIAHRWPVPVMVRVPDNTTLMPELNVGINQLVPGVWIPLRAVGALRKVTQVQKLDSIVVTQSGDESEKITVIMSPAPLAGQDDNEDLGDEDE